MKLESLESRFQYAAGDNKSVSIVYIKPKITIPYFYPFVDKEVPWNFTERISIPESIHVPTPNSRYLDAFTSR